MKPIDNTKQELKKENPTLVRFVGVAILIGTAVFLTVPFVCNG